MKNRALVVLVVLFALCVGPASLEAQWWVGCKTCGWDTYGQAICLFQDFIGPEGGEQCYAGQYCEGSRCWEVCYTQQPCSWA